MQCPPTKPGVNGENSISCWRPPGRHRPRYLTLEDLGDLVHKCNIYVTLRIFDDLRRLCGLYIFDDMNFFAIHNTTYVLSVPKG